MKASTELLVRDRIRRRIEAAAAYPVIIMVAPGGFGKSVALAQFLDTSNERSVRCVVSLADSTLFAFARRLVEVLPLDAAARATMNEALGEQGRPAEELSLLLARSLAQYTGTIAVDDFHYATGESTSTFLSALIDATVPRIRWIIASRSHKDLPIAEWIARETCAAPLTSDELAFTLDEATAAASVLTSIYPEIDIKKILALRGFPLAFILAVRFARAGAGASKVIAQARELTYDYLARHVYDILTADEQHHLQFGALLRAFDCAMFEQAGFSNARRVLHQLYRQGSFLVASERPEVYICNDVFLDFLEDQLRLCSVEEQRALRKIAADMLSTRGRDTEAMRLFAQAQEYGRLIDLLRRRGIELIGEGQHELIAGLLECIPRALRDASASLIALEADLLAREERFARAETLFSRAMELSSDDQERLGIAYRLASHRMLTSVADAERSFSEIAETPGAGANLRLPALSNALLARSWLDPFYDVGPELDEIVPLIETRERDADRAALILNAGVAAMYAGDDRAIGLLAKAEEAAKRKGFLNELCSVYQRRALFALYCDNDLEMARRFADRRRRAAELLSGTRLQRGWLVLNMLIALRAGEAESARALLAEHAALPHTDDASVCATLNRVEAMLAAWSGDYERAYKLLQPILPFVFPFYRPVAQALCVLAGAAAGIDVDAPLDEQVRALRASKPRFARAVEREQTARALLATAASLSGKNTVARRLLHSRKEEPSRLLLLIREVVGLSADRRDNRPVGAPYALEELSRIELNDLRMFLTPLFQTQGAELNRPALTVAEIAVLRLLQQGLKPKEIAELRDTSVHTIRKQLQNVRTKLNSHSTDQVLARARSFGDL